MIFIANEIAKRSIVQQVSRWNFDLRRRGQTFSQTFGLLRFSNSLPEPELSTVEVETLPFKIVSVRLFWGFLFTSFIRLNRQVSYAAIRKLEETKTATVRTEMQFLLVVRMSQVVFSSAFLSYVSYPWLLYAHHLPSPPATIEFLLADAISFLQLDSHRRSYRFIGYTIADDIFPDSRVMLCRASEIKFVRGGTEQGGETQLRNRRNRR